MGAENRPELRIDNSLVDVLRQTRNLEVYLIGPEAVLRRDMQKTYTCNSAYLRADDRLLRVEGIVEDFGCQRDEVFAITVKQGWLAFKYVRDRDTTTITTGELIFDFDGMDKANLIKYDELVSEAGIEVMVIGSCEEMRKDNGDHFCIATDEAVVFRSKGKSILIRQDMFPYVIMVSQDPEMLRKALLPPQ